jgi:hypothetical protein
MTAPVTDPAVIEAIEAEIAEAMYRAARKVLVCHGLLRLGLRPSDLVRLPRRSRRGGALERTSSQ